MPAELRIPESLLPRIYRGQDVLDMPEPDWLLEDFIQKGGITVVYGEPGGGKSLVIQAWANVLAAEGDGWAWAGRERLKRARVLYVMGEGQGGLRGRLFAWQQSRHIGYIPEVDWIMQPIHLWFSGDAPTDQQNELIDLIGIEGYDVVFLDTLAATFGGGNENVQQDMNKYLQVCQEMQKRGASVVIAHHSTKNTKDLRGSTVLHGAADTVVHLQPTFDKETHGLLETVLKAKKQKDGIPFNPVKLVPKTYKVDTKIGQSIALDLGDYEEDRDLRSRILDWLGANPGERSLEDIRTNVAGGNRKIGDMVKQLVEEDYIENPGRGRYLVPSAEKPEVIN